MPQQLFDWSPSEKFCSDIFQGLTFNRLKLSTCRVSSRELTIKIIFKTCFRTNDILNSSKLSCRLENQVISLFVTLSRKNMSLTKANKQTNVFFTHLNIKRVRVSNLKRFFFYFNSPDWAVVAAACTNNKFYYRKLNKLMPTSLPILPSLLYKQKFI